MIEAEAVYTSRPGAAGQALKVYPDRFVLDEGEIPFSEVRAFAVCPVTVSDAFKKGVGRLAAFAFDTWYSLPPIPNPIIEQLVNGGQATGEIELVGWPWNTPYPEPMGSTVVRAYPSPQAFEAGARALELAGYDVFSTTQQDQGPNGLATLALGPLWGLAARGRAHIVVTYKRRPA